MKDLYCVIMAGGRGERFWPESRISRPKQFLDFFGNGTLIEQTVLRLGSFVGKDRIFIITNQDYTGRIRELLPQLPPEHVIGEPCARNTAPCTALAAGIVRAVSGTPNPVMMLLPSDHLITGTDAMIRDFTACAEHALQTDSLATIGIEPSFPSPDYGYIECAENLGEKIFRVKRFLEKPSREKALALLEAGSFKWNSGIFAFPLETLFREMQEHAPDLRLLADNIASRWGKADFQDYLQKVYPHAQKISLDYAIMEHASSIIVREASFEWDDVGNWTSLRNHLPADENGNVRNANAVLSGCENCIISSDDPETMIACIDLKDTVIVRTADAVFACPAASLGKIKTLLASLAEDGKLKKYL